MWSIENLPYMLDTFPKWKVTLNQHKMADEDPQTDIKIDEYQDHLDVLLYVILNSILQKILLTL